MVIDIETGRFQPIDLTKVRFGKLIALEQIGKTKNGTSVWMCKCDCGKIVKVSAAHLRRKVRPTKSCGCLKHEPVNQTHGLRKHPMYSVWSAMKRRCYNEKAENFKDYGGRGITVCERWLHSFENFYDDMKNGYVQGEVMIDRIRVNEGYYPGNCRWLSYVGSANNKRTSKYLSLNGIVRTAAEWAKILGIKDSTITKRKSKGFSDAICLSKYSLLDGSPI